MIAPEIPADHNMHVISTSQDGQLINLRRRVVILGVQLNKAVEAKNVTEGALRKLLDFARGVQFTLRQASERSQVADKSLSLTAHGTLRHRPSDGPLPPSAGLLVGPAVCSTARIDIESIYRTAIESKIGCQC